MGEIVVSHGYGASVNSAWYPYLAKRIEVDGHRVTVPRLPDTAAPQLAPWRETYRRAVLAAGAADSTVLVGHSVGGVNVLRFLEQYDPGVHGVFAGVLLVATPAREFGYDELAEFFAGGFDWKRIRRTARRFRVFQALDDPVNRPDPIEHVRLLVEGLDAVATVTLTGGHFGGAPGDRVDVPEVVQMVAELMAG